HVKSSNISKLTPDAVTLARSLAGCLQTFSPSASAFHRVAMRTCPSTFHSGIIAEVKVSQYYLASQLIHCLRWVVKLIQRHRHLTHKLYCLDVRHLYRPWNPIYTV